MRTILLGSQSYQSESKSVNGQRLVNFYAEKNPEGSKYPFTLYQRPGAKVWLDTGSGTGIQGMKVMDGNLYVVTGNDVYKIDSNKTSVNVGTISGTEERVDLADNGTQLVAVTEDNNGWVITSSTVTQITDGDFIDPSSVTFLDGYHIFSENGSGKFVISDLLDATSYDALDFATAEERPDDLVRVFAFNGALWLLGTETYEVYYNSGNADFPFEQIQGAVNTTRGCAAKYSVVEEDNSFFFLGNDNVVYRTQGYGIIRVSTHAVETAFDSYSTVSDAFAYSYTERGHKFYSITFPEVGYTWVLNIATGFWHEESSKGFNRSRFSSFARFAGKNLVADFANGVIYELDKNTYTDNGDTITRIAQGPVDWNASDRLIYDYVLLDMDSGTGLTSGQGSDPQVMCSYSVDGGKTFSNERWRSFGKIGEYGVRPTWRRGGQSRQRIYKFKITDPVKSTINGAYANVRLGRA